MSWSGRHTGNFGGIGETQYGVNHAFVVMYEFPMSFISAVEARVPAGLAVCAAALRLNAGDKERCPEDSSSIHPHMT